MEITVEGIDVMVNVKAGFVVIAGRFHQEQCDRATLCSRIKFYSHLAKGRLNGTRPLKSTAGVPCFRNRLAACQAALRILDGEDL